MFKLIKALVLIGILIFAVVTYEPFSAIFAVMLLLQELMDEKIKPLKLRIFILEENLNHHLETSRKQQLIEDK